MGEQEQHVYKAVAEAIQAETLDAIVCMAGGWAGGSPASKDFVKNADAMWRQSVWPAAISAGHATKHLREGSVSFLGRLLLWRALLAWLAMEWLRLLFIS